MGGLLASRISLLSPSRLEVSDHGARGWSGRTRRLYLLLLALLCLLGAAGLAVAGAVGVLVAAISGYNIVRAGLTMF